MNILVIGKFSQDQFGFHIADTLRDMGNVVLEFEPTYSYKYYKSIYLRRIHQVKSLIAGSVQYISVFQAMRTRRLSRLLEKDKIDLTITTHDFLFPEEVSCTLSAPSFPSNLNALKTGFSISSALNRARCPSNIL